ncbi:MAG TPA: hypothetical protein VIN59_09660 [Alphaproteobacteria bacterium]
MSKILFLCERNAVRSPMAQSLVPGSTSAGLSADSYVDPFAASILPAIMNHEPRTVDADDLAAADIVIALSRPAFEAAKEWKNDHSFALEYWELPGIPSHDGPREIILEGYQAILKALREHLANRGL